MRCPETSNLKICFICNEYPPALMGGIGRFTQTMAQGLAAAGHGVAVVGLYRSVSAPVREQDGPITVWRLPRSTVPRAGVIINLLRLSRLVRRLYARGDMDVVEAPDYQGDSALLPAAIPCVLRLHSPQLALQQHLGWQVRLERLAVRRAWRLVAVSRWMRTLCAELSGMRGRGIQMIPNPVDPLFQPGPPFPPSEGQQVVFAGTLAPHKGVPELMRAWPRVVDRFPHATLRLFGKDGKDRSSGRPNSAVMQELLPPSYRQTVRWEGPVAASELRDAYRTAHVCVFPSLYESFGLVAVEAMACGRPVVFTSRGAGAEVIEHGVSGLLCDPTEPVDLADAIASLLHDRAFAARIGEAALRRVQDSFALPVILEQNVEMYRSVLQEPARSRWLAR